MKQKTLIIAVVLLALSVILIPPILRIKPWATNAGGLITLASLCEKDLSFNPFSENGYIVRPRMAKWLLMNTEYSYNNKNKIFSIPLVNWVGNEFGMSCINDDGKGYELLEHIIKRGEPLNEYHEGYAPIHSAILNNDSKYLEILLKSGANPSLKIDREGREQHNMNAFEFLKFLESKNSNDYSEIHDLLQNH